MRFTSDKSKMSEFANPLWVKIVGWLIVWIIIILNVKLLFETVPPLVWGDKGDAMVKAVYTFLHLPTPN